MTDTAKKIFVIGFNRCGTRTLHKMFRKNGLKSAHWMRGEVGRVLQDNYENNRPPFQGMDEYDCYMDFHQGPNQFPLLEGQMYFRYFYQHHPDSYFILNTRDEDRWIASRFRHGKERWAKRVQREEGFESPEALAAHWRTQWRDHHRAVREFFAETPGNFLEFNIESDDPTLISAFLKPDFEIDPKFYGWVGKA